MSAPTDNPSAEGPAEPTTPEESAAVSSAAVSSAPLLRVVNADATPEEIAALVSVFASLGSDAPPAPRTTPDWQSHHRKVRPQHTPGPGGWRASGLPH